MDVEKKLLVMKAELLIMRKKITDFRQEVAISSIIHSINEALEALVEVKDTG